MSAAVDTDVLAIYFIFKWDRRYSLAVKIVESEKSKAATIINVLELAGLMSIAQGGAKAREVFLHLHRRRDFEVLYWRRWPCQSAFISSALHYITRRTPLGDALVGWILEEHGVEFLVTWNKRHFAGKFSFNVLTPEEALAEGIY